jgi:hypothetical protein
MRQPAKTMNPGETRVAADEGDIEVSGRGGVDRRLAYASPFTKRRAFIAAITGANGSRSRNGQ